MKKNKVLVVYKESAYSRYLSSGSLRSVLRRGGYLKIMQGSHRRHLETLKGVLSVLRGQGFRPVMLMRDQVDRLKHVDRKFSLVVTVGGDGTLLDASHYVGKTPVLGVNSDPSRSVARFSGCRAETFLRTLQGWRSGRLRPVPVPRLEFSVNGVKGKWPVLNDLLVCTLSPAGTSRYVLKVGKREEEQLSSGVWISTAAGSTAAILSAGGKALPVSARKFQYLVREAYQRKFGKRLLLKGVLGGNGSLEILSRMKDGRVFVDGSNLSVVFRLGDKLRVWVSKGPLRLVGLKK